VVRLQRRLPILLYFGPKQIFEFVGCELNFKRLNLPAVYKVQLLGIEGTVVSEVKSLGHVDSAAEPLAELLVGKSIGAIAFYFDQQL
jgi:hypothetical protein